MTHHWYATALCANGEHERALREIERARELDPSSTSILADEGLIAYSAGRRAQGRAILRALTVEQPDSVSAHHQLAAIAMLEDRPSEYLAEEQEAAHLRGDRAGEAALAARRAIASKPNALLDVMLRDAVTAARHGEGWFRVARIASVAGRSDIAAAALARGCAAHEPNAIAARGDLWTTRSLDPRQIANMCGDGLIS